MKADGFAVMRWLTDGNRLSVHDLKYVIEPKTTCYKPGDVGLALYRGCPGSWKFRILKIGGKNEMKTWLDQHIQRLLVETSDAFCVEPSESLPAKDAEDVKVAQREEEDAQPNEIQQAETVDQHAGDTDLEKMSNRKELDTFTQPVSQRTSMLSDGLTDTPTSDTPMSTLSLPEAHLRKSCPETPRKRRISKLEKEVKELKEDVRYLRRKIRKMEEKHEGKEVAWKEVAGKEVAGKEVVGKGKEVIQTNEVLQRREGNDLTDIKIVVGRINDYNKKFQAICLHFFTEMELKLKSPTGKRTAKCGETVRPPLEFGALQSLYALSQELCQFDQKEAHKKLENFKKMLRRKENK